MTHTLPPRRPLPHRLRLLFVGPAEPPWALLALRLESAGCAQAEFDWETDVAAAMARLRKATFDCVVVLGQSGHDPAADAEPPLEIRFVEGLRGSGSDDPIVVIMPAPDDERTAQLEDLDCELLVSRAGWQSRALVALIRRAVVRGDLRREICGLEVTARRQRLREREEAEGQLQQLREMIALRQGGDEGSVPAESVRRRRPDMVARIEGFYSQLLRTYVMMGSGSLAGEVQQLAELLSLADVSPVEALAIHVAEVDELLQGLGNRSSRHVMARADLLALELMMQLGDICRQKSTVRGLGDAGVDLMHAEVLLNRAADQ
jgi:hypothetical protein